MPLSFAIAPYHFQKPTALKDMENRTAKLEKNKLRLIQGQLESERKEKAGLAEQLHAAEEENKFLKEKVDMLQSQMADLALKPNQRMVNADQFEQFLAWKLKTLIRKHATDFGDGC